MRTGRSGRSTAAAEQSYLATASDLVSALIFVFIIMLAVFAYQLAAATEEQAEVTDELTAGPETRDRILGEIARRLSAAGMNVEVLPEQGVLRLSDNAINFPSGGETPIAEHHTNVSALAQALSEVLPCHVAARTGADEEPPRTVGGSGSVGTAVPDGRTLPAWCRPRQPAAAYECQEQSWPWLLDTLLIEGHTDDVPVTAGHRFRNNLELSSMRSATVLRMIADCEPAVRGLRNSQGHPVLSTSGYGNTRPATSDPEELDENRRIDLRILLEPPEGVFAQDRTGFERDLRQRMDAGR